MPEAAAAPIVLALDAATPPASVALVRGRELLARVEGPFGRGTDGWILGAVDEVLAAAGLRAGDLDALAATVGPGTFTGIRVGLATALGLGRGLELPVAGVGTLEALVAQARVARPEATALLALVDARRGQLYAALSASGHELAWGPELLAPDELADRLDPERPPSALGSGAEVVDMEPLIEPRVAAGAGLWLTDRLAARPDEPLPPPEPVYIRRPDARPGANPLRSRRRRGATAAPRGSTPGALPSEERSGDRMGSGFDSGNAKPEEQDGDARDRKSGPLDGRE